MHRQAELPDPKFTNGNLAHVHHTTQGVTIMSHAPGTAQNTSSASSNVKPNPDTVDTFSAILGPLKVFVSVADEIADVQHLSLICTT
jgi:hypothetical protein